MCSEHTGKKCVIRSGKCGPRQYSCLECNDKANKYSWLIRLLPWGIFVLFMCYWIGTNDWMFRKEEDEDEKILDVEDGEIVINWDEWPEICREQNDTMLAKV